MWKESAIRLCIIDQIYYSFHVAWKRTISVGFVRYADNFMRLGGIHRHKHDNHELCTCMWWTVHHLNAQHKNALLMKLLLPSLLFRTNWFDRVFGLRSWFCENNMMTNVDGPLIIPVYFFHKLIEFHRIRDENHGYYLRLIHVLQAKHRFVSRILMDIFDLSAFLHLPSSK